MMDTHIADVQVLIRCASSGSIHVECADGTNIEVWMTQESDCDGLAMGPGLGV
jgi:hypothetical protein